MKINMMCGKRDFGKDWHHVDGSYSPHLASGDIYMRNWPSEIADLVYCSHGIAYFNKEEVVVMLHSWKRILKPGGTLRIATPNFKMMAMLFNNGLCELKDILGPVYGEMKMAGKPIYHKTGYDIKELTELLLAAGFTDVKLYDHRYTEHPNTGNREDKYDDHSAAYINGHLISLNIECKKL